MEQHTPGPWRLREDSAWPFGLWIEGADGGVILSYGRAAYSTQQKTLKSVMSGRYMDKPAEAAQANALQVANLRVAAAAPLLLEALQLVRMSAGWQYLSDESKTVIDAALRAATGDQS